MNLENFKINLTSRLDSSSRLVLANILDLFSQERMCAFSIYCSTGCEAMGVAFATLEEFGLEAVAFDSLQFDGLDAVLNVSEWSRVNFKHEMFEGVNSLIDDFYSTLFDGDFDEIALGENASSEELTNLASEIFVSVIVRVLRNLRDEGAFAQQGFVAKPLLGLQFGDPSINDLIMIEAVSRAINIPAWHALVVENCERRRKQIA